ncbi:MAG: helix-turn-helix domain-containing protein [Clostridiales bacterium]|nr:helix-turn-helix domain-containing protein [Clostridiales bacterium]
MFHKALSVKFLEGTSMIVAFKDGTIKFFDMSTLFKKYPQLKALENRELFLSGELMGEYGIIWNEDLDIEVETIYQSGRTIEVQKVSIHEASARAVAYARAFAGMTQKELAASSGIDQSDISKIERGIANPSVSTLERIAAALGGTLSIEIKMPAMQ